MTPEEIIAGPHRMVNGEPVALTQEEIDARAAEEAATYPSRLQRACEDQVQLHLDTVPQARGYSSMERACSYVGDPDPTFNAEATGYRNYRSGAWRYCYTELGKVQQRLRQPPTPEGLVAEIIANVPLVLP